MAPRALCHELVSPSPLTSPASAPSGTAHRAPPALSPGSPHPPNARPGRARSRDFLGTRSHRPCGVGGAPGGVLQGDQQLPSRHLPVGGSRPGPVSEKHHAWAESHRRLRDTDTARSNASRAWGRGPRRCSPRRRTAASVFSSTCGRLVLLSRLPQRREEELVHGERRHIEAVRRLFGHAGKFRPLDRKSDESAPPTSHLEAGGPDPPEFAADRQFALRVLDQRPLTGRRGYRLLGVPGDNFPGAWRETLALLSALRTLPAGPTAKPSKLPLGERPKCGRQSSVTVRAHYMPRTRQELP